MGNLKRQGSATAVSLATALLLMLAADAVPAQAANLVTYRIGVDLDNQAGSGCAFDLGSIPPLTLPGFELQVTVLVNWDTMPASIASAQIETCSGATFGNASPLDAFALQFNGGVLSADSVVGVIPKSYLGDAALVRLAFYAQTPSSEDALITVNGTINGAPILVRIGPGHTTPVLSSGGLWLLVVVLSVLVVWQRRREDWSGASIGTLVLLVASLAAAFSAPVATDDPADSKPHDPRVEIVSAFAAPTAGGLALRLDVEDLQGGCTIGNLFYPEAALNPANPCQACSPEQNRLDWTNSSSTATCGGTPSGVCDVQDTCDGSGSCTARFAPASQVCRAPAGACDVAEQCTGSSVDCPGDVVAASGTVCPAGSNECTPNRTCDGSSIDCPAAAASCQCSVEASSPGAAFVPISTSDSIKDLATGQPVANAELQSNLQTGILLQASATEATCRVNIDLPYGCYAVEFLFSELNHCIDGSNPRQFRVTAPELGVLDASVNILQQLGGYDTYYPGAYTASGPVIDGTLNVDFTRDSNFPVISGFQIQPLYGCSITPPAGTVAPTVTPTRTHGTPTPGTPTPEIPPIDFGSTSLPPGVDIQCYTPRPTRTPTKTP